MSDIHRNPTPHGGNDDVAAYALGALEPAEAEAFRRHLEQCVVCRDELAAFDQVVRALPLAADQYRAPDTLRKRVLRAVEVEPKVTPKAERRRARPRRGWFSVPRPAHALAALVAAVAIAIGALELGSSGSSGTRIYNAQVTGSTGTAQVKVTGGHAELILRHFAPPPPGKIYEVWLGRPNRPPQPTSALFSVTAKGAGNVGVPGNLHGVNVVMVTPEPAGGSRVPTHSPVLSARLS
jgi:anti-sigma-K factor RskA